MPRLLVEISDVGWKIPSNYDKGPSLDHCILMLPDSLSTWTLLDQIEETNYRTMSTYQFVIEFSLKNPLGKTTAITATADNSGFSAFENFL